MTKSQKKLLCRDAVVMPIRAVSSSRYSLPQLVEPAYGILAADTVAHVEANVDSVERSGVSGAGLAQKKRRGIEQRQPIDIRTPVQRAVEQERMRLARDVHDVSGQYIVAVTLKLAALENRIADQSLLRHFTELREMLSQLSEELQELAGGLRLAVPRGHLLVAALSELVAQWELRIGIPACFRHYATEKLDLNDVAAEAVYRIAQEALTNVAKHAATASLVTVHLRLVSKHLKLVIEDDGSRPMQQPSASDRYSSDNKHNGIAGMLERVADLGGNLVIRARAAKGTRLVATIPMETSYDLSSGRGQQ